MQTGPRAEVPPRRNQPRGSGRLRGTKRDRACRSITQRRRVARGASRKLLARISAPTRRLTTFVISFISFVWKNSNCPSSFS
jgi:hypothetical protein